MLKADPRDTGNCIGVRRWWVSAVEPEHRGFRQILAGCRDRPDKKPKRISDTLSTRRKKFYHPREMRRTAV